jgi:hypothetical protein
MTYIQNPFYNRVFGIPAYKAEIIVLDQGIQVHLEKARNTPFSQSDTYSPCDIVRIVAETRV